MLSICNIDIAQCTILSYPGKYSLYIYYKKGRKNKCKYNIHHFYHRSHRNPRNSRNRNHHSRLVELAAAWTVVSWVWSVWNEPAAKEVGRRRTPRLTEGPSAPWATMMTASNVILEPTRLRLKLRTTRHTTTGVSFI